MCICVFAGIQMYPDVSQSFLLLPALGFREKEDVRCSRLAPCLCPALTWTLSAGSRRQRAPHRAVIYTRAVFDGLCPEIWGVRVLPECWGFYLTNWTFRPKLREIEDPSLAA